MQGTFLEPDMFFYNREEFFTFLGERVVVAKKNTGLQYVTSSPQNRQPFFTGFIQEMFSPVQELGR